ncbi:hypothetical protein GQ54DRAFT_67089 [Martensiomyces pterosporus]|nr:hypothetical protein GQ54DRAFT_67089 [Martensiomyces pterosporus]
MSACCPLPCPCSCPCSCGISACPFASRHAWATTSAAQPRQLPIALRGKPTQAQGLPEQQEEPGRILAAVLPRMPRTIFRLYCHFSFR